MRGTRSQDSACRLATGRPIVKAETCSAPRVRVGLAIALTVVASSFLSTEDERLMFRTLLKVNRVGAKLALGILSTMTANDFRRCVELEDTTSLSRIPGVGKKTAERLIIEMRDRIGAVTPAGGKATPLTVEANARNEAIDALVTLGYKPREVQKLISKLDVEDKSAEDIIRMALRQVVK